MQKYLEDPVTPTEAQAHLFSIEKCAQLYLDAIIHPHEKQAASLT